MKRRKPSQVIVTYKDVRYLVSMLTGTVWPADGNTAKPLPKDSELAKAVLEFSESQIG